VNCVNIGKTDRGLLFQGFDLFGDLPNPTEQIKVDRVNLLCELFLHLLSGLVNAPENGPHELPILRR
jgi:hypothetical protein